MSDIKTKPASDAYRSGWERTFATRESALAYVMNGGDPLCTHCGRYRGPLCVCHCLAEEHGPDGKCLTCDDCGGFEEKP